MIVTREFIDQSRDMLQRSINSVFGEWYPAGEFRPHPQMFSRPPCLAEIVGADGVTGLAEVHFAGKGPDGWPQFAFFEILYPVNGDIEHWRIYQGTGEEYKVIA